MINAELGHVKTLEEFYSEIRRQQEEAHGDDYCEQHDAIKKYMKYCDSYKDLSKYNRFLRPIAERYCIENNIKLSVKLADSTGFASLGETVDMLLIDSYHRWFHMEKELEMHHHSVRKYMIFHDTNSVAELQRGVEYFCHDKKWEIIERGTTNVGYTVIRKI